MGTLYIVATPIGNLGDFPPRAVEVLRSAEVLFAEDTRAFQTLAVRFGIERAALSCHEHNERERIQLALDTLQRGSDVALISEAGTPLISDPGYRLVHAARESGYLVSTVPGPCAAIAALSISGFECDSFLFRGFLPTKKGRREGVLRKALEDPWTVIFYDSPHRILGTVEMLASLEPDREIFLARELTKRYEECLRGTAGTLAATLANRESIKGEFVLIIRRHRHDRDGGGDTSPDEDA